MRTAVVYQSRYGHTERYAKWISEELTCDIFKNKNVSADDVMPYDTIIFGGGIYAGRVSGIEFISKNFKKFAGKNLIVFTCGFGNPAEEENVENIKACLKNVFSAQMAQEIKLFCLRGGIDYSKLGILHKSMMSMVLKMLLKRDPDTLSDNDKEVISNYGRSTDYTDKDAISPLVTYVKQL